jgi:hypothetical protein
MDIKTIRQLLRENAAVVLVEEGHPPLIVRELQPTEEPQDVPISARWPKSRPPVPAPAPQESVLERLNNEILALKEQIAQEESALAGK